MTVSFATDDLAVARCGRVNITLVRGAIDAEFLDASMREGRAMARQYPEGIASLTLLMSGVPIPDEALRAQSARYAEESSAWLRAGASVVKGDGFGASMARSFLTAVTLFTSGPPRRTFSQPSAALVWLGGIGIPTPPALLPWCEQALSDAYREVLFGAGGAR